MRKPQYKAVIYREEVDENGNLMLKRVTTSQWVTVAQIAATLNISASTMYHKIVNEKVMPYSRHGYQIRVKAEDFAAYQKNAEQAEYERPGAK